MNIYASAIISMAAICAIIPAMTMTAPQNPPAQVATPKGQPLDLFDFWVGDWDISWTDAQSHKHSGNNRIVKILDGKVIEENFTGAATSPPILLGKSVSVFSTSQNVWRQTWVDNQGGYISLTAQVDGDKRMFVTARVVRNGQ
ncbi:MAG: hypothetical protein ABJA67_07160 [Chthonomonadales bacterium]